MWNLLSREIVNADRTPGPSFNNAKQYASTNEAPDSYQLNPPKSFALFQGRPNRAHNYSDHVFILNFIERN